MQGLEFCLHTLQAHYYVIHPDRHARLVSAAGAALPFVPGGTVTTTLFALSESFCTGAADFLAIGLPWQEPWPALGARLESAL